MKCGSDQACGVQSGSGKVILAAIGINTANFVMKLVAWLLTGSHALFSEAIHSAADTVNQVILAYGLQSSAKKADREHPYGYTNMQVRTIFGMIQNIKKWRNSLSHSLENIILFSMCRH